MSDSGIVYLGLCVRYEPPIIGIHYKQKASDAKKLIYTIMLQKLVLNPNAEEVAKQLYLQHPHILKREKIPVEKIVKLVTKIQHELHLDDDEDEYPEEGDMFQDEQPQPAAKKVEKQKEKEPEKMKIKEKPPAMVIQPMPKKMPKFMQNKDDDGQLNRSF